MRTWTLKMTIVVLSVSINLVCLQHMDKQFSLYETDETIYSDGNKILITTVLQKHSEPPNVVTLITSMLMAVMRTFSLEFPKRELY